MVTSSQDIDESIHVELKDKQRISIATAIENPIGTNIGEQGLLWYLRITIDLRAGIVNIDRHRAIEID